MTERNAPPRRALVLGASGFIGHTVVRLLVQQGTRVTAVVRGAPASHAWEPSVVSTIVADLERSGVAADLVTGERPTHVFNLAGYGVDRRENDEARAELLNHHLPRALAEACAPRGSSPGPRLVHVGSAAEYGQAGGTFREDGDARPFTTYGRTKLAGTRAVTEVATARGTTAITARLFTVFGEGEHEGRLFPSLVAAARANCPIDLTDGRQRRDFGWVDDVATALIALADASCPPGEVVNVASGQLHTVEAFVRAAAAALGIPDAHLRFGALPTRHDEMEHDGVSVERLRGVLGASLNPDLREVVGRAVAALRP